MKKIFSFTFILIVLIVGCLVLTGCGSENKIGARSASSSKSFPTAIFIPSGMEYTGGGTIEYSSQNDSSTPKNADAYISNATIEDAVAYVESLKSKGLVNANKYNEEQTGYNEWGSYSWVGVNSDNTFSISVSLTEDSTPLNMVDASYNMLISMSDSNPYAE